MAKTVKEQVCDMLIYHSDEWDCEGYDSVITDLLDAIDYVEAEQIVALLESVIELQGGNEAFCDAVDKMRQWVDDEAKAAASEDSLTELVAH